VVLGIGPALRALGGGRHDFGDRRVGGTDLGETGLAHLESWWLVGLAVWIGFVALILFLARESEGENQWRTWAMAAPVALLLAVLAPPAVVTYRLAADGELSGFGPAGLVVLALWLAVAALFVSAVRRRLG
jgi:hypothetical protein